MIALQAAGGGPPLAVHLPHIVEQIGALAGFAAVAGLAVLSALYFSQARDLRRLREWEGRAPERAAEAAERGQPGVAPLPGRVVAVPQPAPHAVQAPAPASAAGAPGAAPATAQPAAPGSNGAPPADGETAQKEAGEGEEQEEKPAADGEQATDGTQDAAPGEGTQAGEGAAE